MYLYERNEDKVDVYSFIPDKKGLIDYRRKIINDENIDELFYSFETNNYTLFKCFLMGGALDICVIDNDSTSCLTKRPVLSTQKDILEKYINGECSNIIPIQTFITQDGNDCNLECYLRTTSPEMFNLKHNKDYFFDNLMCLPYQLRNLQLLLNGEFSLLNSFNCLGPGYDEQLKYFSAKKEFSISSQDLENIFRTSLIAENMHSINPIFESGEKILQKVRKIRE